MIIWRTAENKFDFKPTFTRKFVCKWYYLRSSDSAVGARQFGAATDTPSPGDYDGDGKADFAVFRPTESTWYILQNANNAYRAERWGTIGDVSIPAAFVP